MKSIERFNATDKKVGDYVYRTYSTEASSEKYGVCEVCGKHVSEVFHQVEGRVYFSKSRDELGVNHLNCHSLYGHKECLLKQQKNRSGIGG